MASSSISLEFQAMDDFIREQQAIVDKKENVKPVQKTSLLLDEGDVAVQNAAVKELGDVNWIGKLMEYRQAHPVAGEGLAWDETEIPGRFGNRFRCTVKIAESDESFGDGNYGSSTKVPLFDVKKNAKKYACMRAIQWLIENKHMPDNGAVKFAKTPVLPPVRSPARAPEETYASQVPELAHRLGFNPPSYVLTQAIPNTPLWSGYADFGADPRVDGKVGEVKDVVGKKVIKEQIAKLVLDFLRDIERHRLGQQSSAEGTKSEEKTSGEDKEENEDEKKDDGKEKTETENGAGEEKGKDEDDSKRKRSSPEPSAVPHNKIAKV
ncbi:hypothetical protein VTL71DRAFT_8163 [Oculimacula yallundae]|uniref:DRBM domain-containing protein n=1 Tax=Oculimacula yallundae TaxID=86028 RepID=A0ABR4CWW7_9HELO